MNLAQIIEQLRNDDELNSNVTEWRHLSSQPARYGETPQWLDERLIKILHERGIYQLYTHQTSAIETIHRGKNVVVVTPTASGKTLCYNLPVLNSILENEATRAIYIFPTKALAQDQLAELYEWVNALGIDIKTYTYDGDTPPNARKAIRSAGHIVITNPDMLHIGILPHHTKWVKLFENLKYIVLDEIHYYRGVFGSHLANVMRRLKRICRFYGSSPQFICCSATIANPEELASKMIEEEIELIDDNGAPRGEKHFIFYNPSVINRELGIRKSAVLETRKWSSRFLYNDLQTIVFARSRLTVEVLVTYLKDIARNYHKPEGCIQGYRGGYLPRERRMIEKGLREGDILGVVSTNALELGIDIGQLEICLLTGYPGTISSTWQQAGRAGRRAGVSAVVLIASSSPLDQYIINHPDYFFGSSPENGLINPDNLFILISHIKCAAFELPFEAGEKFGVETTEEILQFLEEEKILYRVADKWHWTGQTFPAEEIGLRSASTDNFVIIDITEEPKVIGEIDRVSAPMMIHEDAIYIHGGEQYHVEELDYEEKKAYVKKVDVDYYTDAELAVDLKVLDIIQSDKQLASERAWGEVMLSYLATVFKKIKFFTMENVGWGKINLPEEEMHTTAYWVTLPEDITAGFSRNDLQGALLGLSNVLVNVAPLYLMCDPRDIRVVSQIRSPFTQKPTIYLYDNYPGGIGFSQKLYDIHQLLLETALELVLSCGCDTACPSCVGPLVEVGEKGKSITVAMLKRMLRRESAREIRSLPSRRDPR